MLKKLGVGRGDSSSSSSSSGGLWKSKNPHSLEYLKYLQGVLVKHSEHVTEGNKTLLIDALRAITEILIWGDQNDSFVFDFFLEQQMFRYFLSIMDQKSAGSYVNVQLLQTLNILFENIRNETSLYFLLSNNHVNSIIVHSFEFENEEILAYYISFLKTLSFKVNSSTVHFFYNETTEEFPLFSKAIRFYKHSESMVRIAVRTLTLNLFKLKDEGIERFMTRPETARYFQDVCVELAEHAVDMDIFARSAQNEPSNRSRLLAMIDQHIDQMHYVNDILEMGNEKLNRSLVDSFYVHIFVPLYLASLAALRQSQNTVLLSRPSALFMLSQFLYVVHEAQTVQTFLTTLFFGDECDVRWEWIRTMDRGLHLAQVCSEKEKTTERLFFNAHLDSLQAVHDDHACFYALVLIHSICNNKGASSDLLLAAQVPYVDRANKCDSKLAENIICLIEHCSFPEMGIRPITLELACSLLQRLLGAIDRDPLLLSAAEETAKCSMRRLLTTLQPVVASEPLFLEMFEDEYYRLKNKSLAMTALAEDPALYLPPSNTPLSGVQLAFRLPSGNDDRIRHSLQFYFIIRRFSNELLGKMESLLPLSSRLEPVAELNDCINLNNSDLLACTLVVNKPPTTKPATGGGVSTPEKGEKQSRFLVTDQFQLILVEPDGRRLGWALVRFVGLLQDTRVQGDPVDSRSLHVVVEDVRSRAAQPDPKPLLSATLTFDDHIRCMVAKQRLQKGRTSARAHKLNLICDLFEMPRISLEGVHQRHQQPFSAQQHPSEPDASSANHRQAPPNFLSSSSVVSAAGGSGGRPVPGRAMRGIPISRPAPPPPTSQQHNMPSAGSNVSLSGQLASSAGTFFHARSFAHGDPAAGGIEMSPVGSTDEAVCESSPGSSPSLVVPDDPLQASAVVSGPTPVEAAAKAPVSHTTRRNIHHL